MRNIYPQPFQMRRQTFLPAAARLWPKPRIGLRPPGPTAQCPPPTHIFRRQFNFPSTPPKNPLMIHGKLARWIFVIFDITCLLCVISLLPNDEKSSDPFDSPRFTKFAIVSEENVSSTSKILTIQPQKAVKADPYAKCWENGLWSVEFKQPLLQIARSYTPLPPDERTADGDLQFLIRKERNGEMSTYLFGLQPNSEVELRGPHVELELPQNVEDVVFLAGGTGIAPALQLIHTLLEARKSTSQKPRIRVVWANKRREDCIGGEKGPNDSGLNSITSESLGVIVKRLQTLQRKFPQNLQVDYVVDEEGKFVDQKMISQLTKSSSEMSSDAGPDTKLFFISGPEGFIDYFAGPKKWWNGQQGQGELGGVLGRLGINGWKVFKL